MNYYEKYGFADTKKLLHSAYIGNYIVPSLNFITMEQLNAIGDAIVESKSPIILMVAPKHYRQFGIQMLVRMAQSLIERVRATGCQSPIALHLDHGNTFEECKIAIEHGFSSVMIDGSGLPLEENIALTKRVVEYAHRFEVAVEGEVGALSGAEDADEEEMVHSFTDPKEVKKFVEETGVDCLAVSVGTMHGLNKTMQHNGIIFQGLRYDILDAIKSLVPGLPLVLHGCSSLPEKYVQMINKYHGKMEPMVGVPDQYLEQTVTTAVCKINIASDGWIPSMAITRKVLGEHPELIDNRLCSQEIREELKQIYMHKMDIFKSAGKG